MTRRLSMTRKVNQPQKKRVKRRKNGTFQKMLLKNFVLYLNSEKKRVSLRLRNQNGLQWQYQNFKISYILYQLKDRDMTLHERKEALIRHFSHKDEDCAIRTQAGSASKIDDRIQCCCKRQTSV